jgi:hypothetical protein
MPELQRVPRFDDQNRLNVPTGANAGNLNIRTQETVSTLEREDTAQSPQQTLFPLQTNSTTDILLIYSTARHLLCDTF